MIKQDNGVGRRVRHFTLFFGVGFLKRRGGRNLTVSASVISSNCANRYTMLRVYFLSSTDKGQRSINRRQNVSALLLFGTRKIFHRSFFHRVQTLSSETQKLAILSEHTLKVHTPPPSLFVLRYTMYLTRKFVDCPSLCKSEPRDRFIGPLIICILDLDQQVKTGNCCLWVNILSNIVNVRLLQILLTLGCDSDTFIDSN